MWGKALAIGVGLALACPAAALAAPANDNFADRTPLTGATVEITASNAGATKEDGEWLGMIGPAGHSVWYEW
jgi:hypothetical protein